MNQVQSNLVTGCTAVINEELAIKVLPIPAQAIMHDWWMAIAAVAYGRRLSLTSLWSGIVNTMQCDRRAAVCCRGPFSEISGKIRAYQTNPHLFAVAESRAVLRHHGGLSLRQRLGLQLLVCQCSIRAAAESAVSLNNTSERCALTCGVFAGCLTTEKTA